MLKQVFNIAADAIAPEQWLHSRLMLEFHPLFVQYTILHEQTLLAWKYHSFDPAQSAEPQTYLQLLENIVRSDNMLSNRMKEQTVVCCLPESCLLPGNLFEIEVNKDMLELIHGYQHDGTVITEKITGRDMYNVYRLPQRVEEWFKNFFPYASMRHHTSLWLASMDTHLQQVSLLFSGTDLCVFVLGPVQPELVQCFDYANAEDAVYQLLNVFERLHLNRMETPVNVCGMVETDSAIYVLLQKYFNMLHVERLDEGFNLSEKFRSVPEHFLSPLLKMYKCV